MKPCEFLNVWVDRADLGSQKSFSKLATIFPRKTHDNFQIDIQKITHFGLNKPLRGAAP